MTSNVRVAKRWPYNSKNDVASFDLNSLNETNLVNQLLILKQSDISYSLIMNLFGNFNGKSLCNPYDEFIVPKGRYSYFDRNKNKNFSNKEPFLTTIGIFIFNVFMLNGFNFSYLFGGYINKNINNKEFKNINQILTYALAEDKITVEEFKKWNDYTQFLMPFEDILGNAHTENVLRFSKDVEKKKQEFIDIHGDELKKGNIVVAEKMEKDLIAYARETLKDDPGLDPYISGGGGNMDNNFKNLYIMKGPARDPDPNAKQQYNVMTSNYFNGITADEYSILANSLAAGPYSRAKKTEKGGYWEKLMGYALQTVILEPAGSDCGSKQYIEVELTKNNINDFMYNYIVKSNGSLEELTSENMNNYIGKKVKMRFSIFCKSKNGICNKCAGNLFYRRGAMNVGTAMASIASVLKNKSMKAFHDSTIETVEIDPMVAFSID